MREKIDKKKRFWRRTLDILGRTLDGVLFFMHKIKVLNENRYENLRDSAFNDFYIFGEMIDAHFNYKLQPLRRVVGEGGFVYSEPGMRGNVILLDEASMCPSLWNPNDVYYFSTRR